MSRDFSLGLILLYGLGLVGNKAVDGQAPQQAHDTKILPCIFSSNHVMTPEPAADELSHACIEYRYYPPDTVPAGRSVIATVHMAPLQNWQPTTDIHFALTTHLLVRKEKECSKAFSLAGKGIGSPMKYVCENEKSNQPYEELQCDGDKKRQNCSGLRYENGKPIHAVLRIEATLQ